MRRTNKNKSIEWPSFGFFFLSLQFLTLTILHPTVFAIQQYQDIKSPPRKSSEILAESSSFLDSSPIPNLSASLLASSSRSTVVAVHSSYCPRRIDPSQHPNTNPKEEKQDEECVVLLTCSSRTATRARSTDTNTTESEYEMSPKEKDENDSLWIRRPLPTIKKEEDWDISSMTLESSKDSWLQPCLDNPTTSCYSYSSQLLVPPLHDDDPNGRILHFLYEPLGLCVALIGVTSDIRFLLQSIEKYMSEHQLVYDDQSILSAFFHKESQEYRQGHVRPDEIDLFTTSWNTHKILKESLVSTLFRTASGSRNGQQRTLGVQALLVGTNSVRPKKAIYSQKKKNSLHVYTVDPSGNWKHWGSGSTSIGAFGFTVRKAMAKMYPTSESNVSETNHSNTSFLNHVTYMHTWQEALYFAMKALVQALQQEGVISSLNLDTTTMDRQDPTTITEICRRIFHQDFHIHATIVFGDEPRKKRTYRWAHVSPSFLFHTLHEILSIEHTVPTEGSSTNSPTIVHMS